ncbi:unnamed protein product [Parnassius apollo]|uniref:(apollo) hypothetical protein n=1 Tax=Parnassius apollo TaxID=110799 RepID=A0A8S3XD38_PARAO|nr:unnamed protein product [Parnassius apollo]
MITVETRRGAATIAATSSTSATSSPPPPPEAHTAPRIAPAAMAASTRRYCHHCHPPFHLHLSDTTTR